MVNPRKDLLRKNMTEIRQISVQVGSGFNLLTKKQWLKLSKLDRIERLTGGLVAFLDENGEQVAAVKALEILKKTGWLD